MTLAIIFLQTALDKLGRVTRAVGQYVVVGLVIDDAVVNSIFSCLGAVIEGRSSGEQDVRDHTYGPNIDFIVVIILLAKLRSHIKGTSQAEVLPLVVIVSRRKAKVCKLDSDLLIIDVCILLNQDVLWLQVPMHDVLFVHKVQSQK